MTILTDHSKIQSLILIKKLRQPETVVVELRRTLRYLRVLKGQAYSFYHVLLQNMDTVRQYSGEQYLFGNR